MKSSLFTAVALFAFATSGLAAAQPPAGKSAPAVTIPYNDLNLNDPRDAKVMLRRIRTTAVEICHPGETGFEMTARFEDCYRQTVDRAVAELNAPRVTAAHSVKARGPMLARMP